VAAPVPGLPVPVPLPVAPGLPVPVAPLAAPPPGVVVAAGGGVALGVVAPAAEPDDEGEIVVEPVVAVVPAPVVAFLTGASEARIDSAWAMKLCQMIAG
jgi:hypothetical protein